MKTSRGDAAKLFRLETGARLRYSEAAVEFAALKEASVETSNAAADAIKTLEKVAAAPARAAKHSGTSFFADESRAACRDALKRDCDELRAAGFRSGACGTVAVGKKSGETDAGAVADCRRTLAAARAAHASALAGVERVKARTFYLEDLVRCRDAGVVAWSFGQPPSTHQGWLWHCKAKPLLLKTLAVACAIASGCLIMSEAGAAATSTNAARDCSAFAVMVRSGARSNGDAGAAAAAMLCLSYMVFCAGWAMSLIKVRGCPRGRVEKSRVDPFAARISAVVRGAIAAARSFAARSSWRGRSRRDRRGDAVVVCGAIAARNRLFRTAATPRRPGREPTTKDAAGGAVLRHHAVRAPRGAAALQFFLDAPRGRRRDAAAGARRRLARAARAVTKLHGAFKLRFLLSRDVCSGRAPEHLKERFEVR